MPKPAAPPPTESVVINLIRLLVEQGVLTKDKADALIAQAQNEAAAAKAQNAAANEPKPAAAPTGAAADQPPSTTVRVPYVPEIVKRQITDDVKKEVLATAERENWASPNALPDWVRRIKWEGDIRLRYENDRFDPGNASGVGSGFFDFNSINSGNPLDLALPQRPFIDTTADRQRMLVRARLGLQANIADDVTAGVRVATGNSATPVSTNQTLGSDFSKYSVFFDRAYLQYQPDPSLTLWGGRMPNPWLSTSLVWSSELNFDGIAGTYRLDASRNVKPFLTAGVFPVENTTFNFPETNPNKQTSHDKWLYAVQAGADWRLSRREQLRMGVAYYDFHNVQGEFSSPCTIQAATDPCDTDLTRPNFMQKGNTLFPIRNIQPNTLDGGPPGALPEYFGLASQFRELNATAQFDMTAHDPYHLILDGDFVTNLAFNRAAMIAKFPVNNVAGAAAGNLGFMAQVTYGMPQIAERWDWNAYGGYKYLESDAVVDAFTDSDFHLGGTNARGFFIGGNLGLSHNFWMSARWLSSNQVSGPPLAIDVIQVDLNGKF